MSLITGIKTASSQDLIHISAFNKIVRNYLKMREKIKESK